MLINFLVDKLEAVHSFLNVRGLYTCVLIFPSMSLGLNVTFWPTRCETITLHGDNNSLKLQKRKIYIITF